MTEYPELYILRHGQTYWNREGRIQGQIHSDLTSLGQDHARQQGKLVAELKLIHKNLPIFVSPQGRVLQTAELALAPLGRYGQIDDRLMEIGCGIFEGHSLKELEAESPGTLEARDADAFGWYFDIEGGETKDDMEIRVRSFLDDLAEPSLVVTHGITSRFLRGIWLGLERDDWWDFPVEQGCIYHLSDGVHRVIS